LFGFEPVVPAIFFLLFPTKTYKNSQFGGLRAAQEVLSALPLRPVEPFCHPKATTPRTARFQRSAVFFLSVFCIFLIFAVAERMNSTLFVVL
jgi:hypothetical protein